MRENQSTTMVISWIRCFGKERKLQPRTQACSRYPNDQRRLGTERDRRTWQVTSHPKSPRTTGNEAEKWRNSCRTQNQTWYLLFYHTRNTLINVIKEDWSKLPCYAYSLLIFTPKCPLFIATMLMNSWGGVLRLFRVTVSALTSQMVMKSSLQVGHCSNLKVIRTLLEFSEASNHQVRATKSPQCELCVLRTQAQNEPRQQRQSSFTYRRTRIRGRLMT